MNKELLREYAVEAKRCYLQLRGIGFFTGSLTTPASLDIFRDELSKGLYPGVEQSAVGSLCGH